MDSNRITRRAAFASIGALVSTAALAVPAITLASPNTPPLDADCSETDLVAIPREAFDAIKAWQEADRAAGRAARAYSDHMRAAGLRCRAAGRQWVFPDDKAALDRLFAEHVATSEVVAPAQARMIEALQRLLTY